MARMRGQCNRLTADEMRILTAAYFTECEEVGKMPSITGYALYLGFTGRTALQRYIDDSAAKKSPLRDCVDIVTRARAMIEEANIQALYSRDTTSGAQFALKNGFGYAEKQEISNKTVINVQITDDGDGA